MSDFQILPCPFCGINPEISSHTTLEVTHIIMCKNWECGTVTASIDKTLDKAIKKWNRRP